MNTLPDIPHGAYADVPEAEYRAHFAIANSDLKYANRSLAHYYDARIDPEREPEKPSASKSAGRALHCAILEPDTFDARFALEPEDAPKDLRHFRNAAKPGQSTIDSCKFWDEFEEVNKGKEILDKKSSQQARKAGARIRNHPEVAAWLGLPGAAEESIFGIDPVTGLLCKIRTDWRAMAGDLRVIVDVKSCEDARPHAFQRTAYNYGYFQGAAFYSDVHEWAGLGKVDLYVLVAFERDNPGAGVKVYEVSGEEIEFGRAQYRRGLSLVDHSRQTNEYPGYSPEIERLRLPGYAQAIE